MHLNISIFHKTQLNPHAVLIHCHFKHDIRFLFKTMMLQKIKMQNNDSVIPLIQLELKKTGYICKRCKEPVITECFLASS